jgi:hypothetical protein
MRKTILAAFAAALLASVAGFAAEPSSPAGGAQPALSVAAPDCGQTLGSIPSLAGIPALALQSNLTRAGELAGPACTLAVADRGFELGSRPFHGFCRCSCTFRPDCNTSADCGGAPCLHAITCC